MPSGRNLSRVGGIDSRRGMLDRIRRATGSTVRGVASGIAGVVWSNKRRDFIQNSPASSVKATLGAREMMLSIETVAAKAHKAVRYREVVLSSDDNFQPWSIYGKIWLILAPEKELQAKFDKSALGPWVKAQGESIEVDLRKFKGQKTISWAIPEEIGLKSWDDADDGYCLALGVAMDVVARDPQLDDNSSVFNWKISLFYTAEE